ncbi:MAG: hypothetical protein HOY71_17710 [Nonomuraea sp.]|nr:hypothetical protein [Nonomuraea sp.]
MFSPRLLAASAAILGVAVLVVLYASGLLSLGAAAATCAFLILLAALAYLVLSLRRIDGKAQRIDQRVKKYEAELAKTTTGLKRIETRIDRLTEAVERSNGRHGEDLGAILASLGEDRVNAMARAREVEQLREEIRALAKDPV